MRESANDLVLACALMACSRRDGDRRALAAADAAFCTSRCQHPHVEAHKHDLKARLVAKLLGVRSRLSSSERAPVDVALHGLRVVGCSGVSAMEAAGVPHTFAGTTTTSIVRF